MLTNVMSAVPFEIFEVLVSHHYSMLKNELINSTIEIWESNLSLMQNGTKCISKMAHITPPSSTAGGSDTTLYS